MNCIVYGVAKSWKPLSNFHFQSLIQIWDIISATFWPSVEDHTCAICESSSPRSYPWVSSTSFMWLAFSQWQSKTVTGAQKLPLGDQSPSCPWSNIHLMVVVGLSLWDLCMLPELILRHFHKVLSCLRKARGQKEQNVPLFIRAE